MGSPAPKLSRYSIDMLRANVDTFLEQNHGDTCVLMPMLPKRILAILDTVDTLYDELKLQTGETTVDGAGTTSQ